MKTTYLSGLAAVLLASTAPLYSESYIGGSAGFLADLGQLGRTIAIDGLNSLHGKPTMTGAATIGGCNNAPDPVACRREQPGDPQRGIYAENELLAFEKNTGGIINSKISGSMTGLLVNLFYESQNGSTFWRIGVNYTRKVLGGDSQSSVAGIKWYDVHWDYMAYYVPVYYGIRTNPEGDSSFYAALGLHYYDAGFNVGGMNNGEIPTYFLGGLIGSFGATTVYDAKGQPVGGPIFSEWQDFHSRGIGFSALLGAERKLASGNKVYIEITHIFSGDMASSQTQDIAGKGHFSPVAAFPAVLVGTGLSFGYKKAL